MESAYDDLIFRSQPRKSSPDLMAAGARIRGLDTPDPTRCRVLEIGPGDGLSLIALGCAWPEARFVGVDFSAKSIQAAEETRRECGVTNVEFQHRDLLELGPDFGKFDYIIANGLYSWVPEPVREHLLKICSQNLASSGVACITYNTYPGCHLRRMVRDMLMLHVGAIEKRSEKIEKARSFLEYLRDTHKGTGALSVEIEETLGHADELLYHDDLAPINEPVYLHEFTAHASRFGLSYVGDTAWIDFQDRLLPPAHRQALVDHAGDDRIQQIQYMDFIRNRRFRRSLLCHASHSLERDPRPEFFLGLSAGLCDRLVELISEDDGTLQFKSSEGKTLSTNQPYISALLKDLARTYPRPLALGDLDADAMDMVLMLCAAELIELRSISPAMSSGKSVGPVASPLARLEIRRGRTMVINLRQRAVDLAGTPAVAILPALDGSRSRQSLRAEFGTEVDEILSHLGRLSLLSAQGEP